MVPGFPRLIKSVFAGFGPVLTLTILMLTNHTPGLGYAQTSEPRSLSDIRLDTRAVLRRSAQANDEELQPMLLDLCWLHQEITRHPRFPDSSTLRSSRATIAARLNDIQRRLKRINRSVSANQEIPNVCPEIIDSFASSTWTDRTDAALRIAHDRHFRAGLFKTGGPAAQLRLLYGHFAPGDNVGELINLIVMTIDRNNWLQNGGKATIGYYEPACALIVTASQKTHDEIELLLEMLR